jgi:hypothetical protein
MTKSCRKLDSKQMLQVTQYHPCVLLPTDRKFSLALSHWDRAVASLQGKGHIINQAFHSFDTHLVTSNDDDIITFVQLPSLCIFI